MNSTPVWTFDSLRQDMSQTSPLSRRIDRERMPGSSLNSPDHPVPTSKPENLKRAMKQEDSPEIEIMSPPKKRKVEVIDLTQSDDELKLAPRTKWARTSLGLTGDDGTSVVLGCPTSSRAKLEGGLSGYARRDAGSRASRPPKPVLKECTICFDEYDIEVLPTHPHEGADQAHPPACYTCWESHLLAELERKPWDRLSCPTCSQVLSLPEIANLDVYFQHRIEPKIMDLATKAALTSDPDWVPCPSGTCQSGALMDGQGGGHIFTCQECQYRYCTSCQTPMHEDETCTTYQERLRREPEKQREEDESLKAVEKYSKACPKCATRLQKRNGCDHFTCGACKHEFCWLCFADYKGPTGITRVGNGAHNEGCMYLPGRLPTYDGPERGM